ncbi:MAG: cupin domain-containing protein [Desulfomonilaceae bacterium]
MSVEIEIGQRIRSRRQSNHLTLKQLGQRAGCSDAYLSQIENGRVSPSISTLKKIAEGLQAKITDFFVESQNDDPVVLAKDQRITLSLDRWNAKIQSLVLNPKNKRMHPFFTTIQPGGGSHGLYSHVGEEFGIILQGELEIDLNGVMHRVKEQESFYYNSSDPHSWTNPGEIDTIVVWVISPPTF